MANLFQRIFNPNNNQSTLPGKQDPPLPAGSKRNPTFRIAKYQLSRERVDVQGWRDAINEAESAYNPYRVKMNRMFQDTVMNEHIEACIIKRKNLTLLRGFKICDEKGIADEDVAKIFQKTWFGNLQSFIIDGQMNGYNLISLGSIIDDGFPELTFIRPANVSPDRLVVSNFPYQLSGMSWYDPAYVDWYIYIKTPTENGISPCGYGLLYRIAKTEIFHRNNVGYNADYNEMFGIPIRKGKTDKQDEERNEFEAGLRNMGSTAYMLLDNNTNDDLELIEAKNSGSTYNTYKDFEERLEAKISKIILGHKDAMDSVPGKLGAQQGEDNPIYKALKEIQSRDANFIEPFINNDLLPKMRNLGFNIPDNLHFEYLNDEEAEDFRKKEDESNQATATIMKTIKDAGGKPDWKYFNDRTGMKVEEAPPPTPPVNNFIPSKNGNGLPAKEPVNGN